VARGRGRPAARWCGFTLIEMLAVLAIMGLMMGLTIGAFNHWGRGSRLRGSLLHLKSSMSMARQFAITRRVRTTFACGNTANGDRGYYSITRNDSGAQVGATNYLADGIVFSNQTYSVEFRLDGSCETGTGAAPMTMTIMERNQGAALIADIKLYPLTGRVKVITN
jgi:prepilin-type N-terminal cleavage/methylation domain-containing protein